MENMHSDVKEYRVKRYFKELFRFFKASSSKKVSSTELDFFFKTLPSKDTSLNSTPIQHYFIMYSVKSVRPLIGADNMRSPTDGDTLRTVPVWIECRRLCPLATP